MTNSELSTTADAVKFNLGAGAHPLDGWVNIDRKMGKEAYPLDAPDSSIDVIRASHVLEHFSHTEVHDVLVNWVSKLKAGGQILIAVPDFDWICEKHLAGEPMPTQGFVMGGHVDEDDHHGAIFDEEALRELMICSGLERIGSWISEIEDCAALEVSLNLTGFKPITEQRQIHSKIAAVVSQPRFGPTMFSDLVHRGLKGTGIDFKRGDGAYWHQILSNVLESAIREGAEFLLTLDFDSVFHRNDILELYRLMEACPEIDALCALQMKRKAIQALFGIDRPGGRDGPRYIDMNRHVMQVDIGHFGLTLLRADKLDAMPRPWMVGRPNENGLWDDGKVDPDIEFWHNWKKAGNSLYLAPKIVIGHMEDNIRWPGKNLEPVIQDLGEYLEKGIPPQVPR